MMSSVISIMEKKEFLRWFLNEFQLKRRECAWLLNYLISDDSLMEQVHFVEKASCCPRALIISTTDVESIPFCFHKNQHITMDAEKAFHDIRLNNDEPIYIQLNFQNSHTNPNYVSVLEENPFSPVNQELATIDSLLAEMILEKAIHVFEKKRLEEEINKALDSMDETLFKELTDQLNKLKP